MIATANNFKLVAALEYAAIGWLVFPVYQVRESKAIPCACGAGDCTQIGKHPRTANGLLDGTTDAQVIERWWDRWPIANIGITTGAKSGIIVIDEDPRHGGDASLKELVDSYGPLPDTVTATTGGGGGHYIFSHPGQYVPNDSLGQKLGAGLDIRGDGGYIVAPPSNHKSGGVYGWRSGLSPDDIQPAPMPAWLRAMVVEHPPETAKQPARVIPKEFTSSPTEFWLERALSQAVPGHRNEIAFWLACQLRDARLGQQGIEAVLREFAARVPQGDEGFTEREAVATVRSAMRTPAREPAKGPTSRAYDRLIIKPAELPKNAVVNSASTELKGFIDEVIAGRIYNVPFPWMGLTRLTQALLPGSIMSLCGDPGVGKTYWTLQCLRFWQANDFRPRVFFIEKDRRFHTQRLLAQLEGNGGLVDLEWIKANGDATNKAWARHEEYIDSLGECIASHPGGRISLADLIKWMEKCAEDGARVMTIDPITMAYAGADRWLADDDFISAAQQIVAQSKSSLIVVTHPKKGNRQGRATGHDMALGAAYLRFVDTVAWLSRPKKDRHVRVRTQHGPATVTPDIFCQLEKTRDGKGSGLEIAMRFKGNGLNFKEEGLVEKDIPLESEET